VYKDLHAWVWRQSSLNAWAEETWLQNYKNTGKASFAREEAP
jgi:hypothetical protein